jgi:hypothetical protein
MSEQVLFEYLWVFDVSPSNGKAFARKQPHREEDYPALSASPSAGDGLRRTLKAEHALVPRLDGEPVGFLARFRRPLCRCPDRRAVDGLA